MPIATSAAAITLEHEGYVVEPAIDFNQQAGYLSIAKAHDRFAFKGSYAFKEVRAAARLLNYSCLPTAAPPVTCKAKHVHTRRMHCIEL